MSSLNKEWQCVLTESGPDLKLFKTRFDFMKKPDDEQIHKMIILDSPDSANVIALTPEGKIVFVRQFRFGIKEFTVELPGGIIETFENHEKGVQRELEEETGYTAQNWQYLGKVPSNPVFMNSYIHHWVADNARLTGTINWDEAEEMDLILYSVEETRKLLYKGFFQHSHTSNALILFFQWLDKSSN